MLIEYGNTKVSDQWFVTEKRGTGYARIYYIFDGDVAYCDSYTNCKLKKDYLYVLPTATPYSMTQNIFNRLHCTFIHADFSPLFSKEIKRLKVEKDTFLFFILSAIRKAIDEEEEKIVLSICSTLTTYLIGQNLFSLPPSPIYTAVEFMNENYKSALNIKEISKKLGYNSKYFSRLFKKHMEVSPYEYIMNLRFKEALLLFRQDYTLTQIAKIIGYNDLKTFSRAFKNKYKISPQNYKDNFTFME